MYLPHLYRPPFDSHKGQNGRLLIIGGSKLFHSSIFWSADVASRVVDIVHFTSPANENNEIVRKKIKASFWTGIVVDWGNVEEYIQEDDAVLIGPGMARDIEGWGRLGKLGNLLRKAGENDQTSVIINTLLKKYPTKKWVIDGGALQMVDPKLITESCILTPHKKEFLNLTDKSYKNYKDYNCANLSQQLERCTILLKGPTDTVCQGQKSVEISGRRASNPGMTKGGTGDVLAGLVAALYTKNDAWTAATTGSYVTKQAGEKLYQKVGPYFNAQDLLNKIPEILKEIQITNIKFTNQ